MPTLNEILQRIVDLRASEWAGKGTKDEKEIRQSGAYNFTKKVYVDYGGVIGSVPPFKFSFNQNHPYAIADWKNKWQGCTFVTTADPYFPEGTEIDANGHYVMKDTVLMKIPILEYIRQRKKEMQASRESTETIQKALRSEFGRHGLTQEEIQREFGQAPK